MASSYPRSALKSSNSPSRSWRTVSFQEERRKHLLKNFPGNTSNTTTYYYSPDRRRPSLVISGSFTSQDKRDYSRELHASFAEGPHLSVFDITCDEIDDILPKTDYTYTRSASYSPQYSQETYISPNMSRRRLRSLQPVFLSDDEEEFSTYENDQVVVSNTKISSKRSQYAESEQQSFTAGSQRLETLRVEDGMTSTPVISHGQNHISTNDHYYEGILLRSGSHIKGPNRYYGNQMSARSENNAFLSEAASNADKGLSSASRSDINVTSRRHNAKNVTTTTEITTTTTTSEPSSRKGQSKNYAFQQLDDYSERKLRFDESQTEKEWNNQEYKLKHLYGLDSEEEISDIDDETRTELKTTDIMDHHLSQRGSSFFSFLLTVITTVITTVTSTFSDGSSSVIKPFGMAASKSVVSWGQWLLQVLADSSSWLITKSATFLLWDIEVKQKRRRGCCCGLLPWLFLLPLLLLGGYYTRGLQQNMGSYLSGTRQVLSSPWSYLWFTSSSSQEVPITVHSPPVSTPVSIPLQTSDQIPATERAHQVNMAHIYEYIQQTVAASATANRDYRPAGLTKEQVEAIVMGLLASKINEVTTGLEGRVDAIKIMLQGDMASLQRRIAELETEIKITIQAHQALADNLNQAQGSFEGTYGGQKVEWLAASQTLERKLLNLTQEVNNLSSHNSALAAMLTNCCRNNSALPDDVRGHIITVLSQMGTDENSQLAGVMRLMAGHYVDKAEMDQRLSAISVEIMDSLKAMLSEVERKPNTSAEVETSIFAGMNELTVKSFIEEALARFSADRVGMPDYALESAGGSVVSVRCSETYYKKTALVSVFGIPLWYTSNSPRTVIQPDVHPGECWAFKGQSGYIVFQLSHPIMPTGFTLEHIPRSLAPKGDISSAPKDFAVYGLISESDTQGINLGNYTYLDNEKPIQFFPVQSGHPGIFQLIELRVLDNHSNREYTCIYRFRVHGQP